MKGRSLFERNGSTVGTIKQEIAVYRWHVLGPKDIIILGLINVKDGVRRTLSRSFLSIKITLC